jgi:hypothetical protein
VEAISAMNFSDIKKIYKFKKGINRTSTKMDKNFETQKSADREKQSSSET